MMFPSVAILHGTDKGKDDWSYNPTWFSTEDKVDKGTADAPAKGLNTAASGDISPAPVSSPPLVSSSLPARLPPPPQTSDLVQAPNMPPVTSTPVQAPPNIPPVNLLPTQASDLMQASPVNTQAPSSMAQPPQASDLVQAPKIVPLTSPPVQVPPNVPPVNLPPTQASDLVQDSNMLPVTSRPVQAPPNIPPVNTQAPPNMSQPPQASDLVQASNIPPANVQPVQAPPIMAPPTQASYLVQGSNMPPVTSPPVQAPPNIPPVNTQTPPNMVQLPQASDLVQASNIPPANVKPVQTPPNMAQPPQVSHLVQGSNMLPVTSPPVQAPPNLPPPTQASNLVQAPNMVPLTSLPEQAPNMPPGNSPPPPNTPPARDSYCPAGPYFNKFSSVPNYLPQSGYNPMGPTLGSQVGSVPQCQTTTNTIVVQLGTAGPTVSDFNLMNYLRNPTKYIGAEDYEDAYRGAAKNILEVKKKNSFLHTITCHKLKNLDYPSAILVNVIRLIYFLFQFIYPIIVAIVDKGPVAFNVVCTLFAFVGLVYDISQIIVKLKRVREKKGREKKGREKKEGKESEAVKNIMNEPQPEGIANPQELSAANVNELIKQATGGDTATSTALAAAEVQVKSDKNSSEEKTTTPKEMLYDFVQEMLEEIIIYPSLICNLYSFVNGKGWQFDSAFDGFDFLLTLVSFVMDAVWAKINHIWALSHLIKSAIDVQKCNKISSYVTPVSLFIPYSIGLAIAHTLMLILIAIRIYADNFNTRDREKEPKEGDYSVAPFTRYMIFCGAYLPLMSGACYIILNKHWFLQISWILYNDKDAPKKMHYLNITSMPTRVKLFGFLRDKCAYIAVATFAPLFIAFYTGGFLRDYDPEDLPKGALGAATAFGTLFVLVFGIINIQAGIIFTIIMILLMIMFCVICTGGSSRNVRNNYRR